MWWVNVKCTKSLLNAREKKRINNDLREDVIFSNRIVLASNLYSKKRLFYCLNSKKLFSYD